MFLLIQKKCNILLIESKTVIFFYMFFQFYIINYSSNKMLFWIVYECLNVRIETIFIIKEIVVDRNILF